jgi:predicted DNA-binding protein (MmcQ/YjbR family)
MNSTSNQAREAVERLREVCLSLPGAIETTTFGHPTFQAGKKQTFAVLDDHEQEGMLCLVFKVDPHKQARLVDGKRFFRSKFGAKHGWTAMKIDARTAWSVAKRLVMDSYRRVALKKMIAALDAAVPKRL